MKLIKQHNYSIKSTTYDKTHEKSQNFRLFRLTAKTRLNYIKRALAKSKAQDCKPVFIYKANSAPTCAFFVHSVFAPIQNNLSFDRLFPMVAHSGEGSALHCFPCITVLQPVMCYRPSLQTFAVVPENLYKETTQMYQFIFALMRTPTQFLKIRILADNEPQARARFTDGDSLLFVGRINLHRQNTHQNHRTFAKKGGKPCAI